MVPKVGGTAPLGAVERSGGGGEEEGGCRGAAGGHKKQLLLTFSSLQNLNDKIYVTNTKLKEHIGSFKKINLK